MKKIKIIILHLILMDSLCGCNVQTKCELSTKRMELLEEIDRTKKYCDSLLKVQYFREQFIKIDSAQRELSYLRVEENKLRIVECP